MTWMNRNGIGNMYTDRKAHLSAASAMDFQVFFIWLHANPKDLLVRTQTCARNQTQSK